MKQEVDQKEQEEAEGMKQVSRGTLENVVRKQHCWALGLEI